MDGARPRGGPAGPAAVSSVAHVFVGQLDDRLRPAPDDEHHLARVLRVRPGEVVTAADGLGGWRRYAADPGGDGLWLTALSPVEVVAPLRPAIAVAFGLTKGSKPETLVAGLTELGVDRILPVMARRSVVRWDDAKAAEATARLRRVAREASMQSRRVRLPVVEPVGALSDLAGHPALVVGVPGAPSPGSLSDLSGGHDEVLAVVGPEGGFDPAELEHLAPRRSVGLVPTVLRAETAGVAMAAVLTTMRSNWYEE